VLDLILRVSLARVPFDAPNVDPMVRARQPAARSRVSQAEGFLHRGIRHNTNACPTIAGGGLLE